MFNTIIYYIVIALYIVSTFWSFIEPNSAVAYIYRSVMVPIMLSYVQGILLAFYIDRLAKRFGMSEPNECSAVHYTFVNKGKWRIYCFIFVIYSWYIVIEYDVFSGAVPFTGLVILTIIMFLSYFRRIKNVEE